MEADNEDGKSFPAMAPADLASSNELVTVALVKPETVQPKEPVNPDGEFAADSAIEVVGLPMNDEYEAYIRQMTMEEWLSWKVEVGYTFNLSELDGCSSRASSPQHSN